MAQSLKLNRLVTLAKTSLLGAVGASGTSIQEIIEQSTPGFGFLQAFFATWLKLDLTTIAAALTIFGTISGALQDLQGLAFKVYWWFTRFSTASISIASNDRLNREILNWIGAQVLTRQGTRILTARTEAVETDAWHYRRTPTPRNDYHLEKRVPIQYLPTFGTTWFFHERNLFMVRRISANTHYAASMPIEYSAAPEGDEPLVVMCLGRSVLPIKRFFDSCRDFADKQRESFITIRACKGHYHGDLWDTTIVRPIRPIETVHFDETTKAEVVADIRNYLDPSTRRFYTERGIPYRRGFLLHGPPGTGKTSLSLALAGHFGLELYLVHIPSVREDSELQRLFTALPPRCIVLLEDIDVVGLKRQAAAVLDDDSEDEDEEDEEDLDRSDRSRCTLSGVLNVLDGVSSQEGRIVLMTSNMAHKLDKALIRPGRIDRMIFLGNISQKSAELMFLRMYAPDRDRLNPSTLPEASLKLVEIDLQKLALKFSSQIPENTFTPAQLQGYLLNRRNSPILAATEVSAWVEEETAKIEQAKVQAKEKAAKKAKKRKRRAMKALAKTLGDLDLDSGAEKPAPTANAPTVGDEEKDDLTKAQENTVKNDTNSEKDKPNSKEDAPGESAESIGIMQEGEATKVSKIGDEEKDNSKQESPESLAEPIGNPQEGEAAKLSKVAEKNT